MKVDLRIIRTFKYWSIFATVSFWNWKTITDFFTVDIPVIARLMDDNKGFGHTGECPLDPGGYFVVKVCSPGHCRAHHVHCHVKPEKGEPQYALQHFAWNYWLPEQERLMFFFTTPKHFSERSFLGDAALHLRWNHFHKLHSTPIEDWRSTGRKTWICCSCAARNQAWMVGIALMRLATGYEKLSGIEQDLGVWSACYGCCRSMKCEMRIVLVQK